MSSDPLALPEVLLRSPPFLMIQILRAGRRAAETSPRGPQLGRICVVACLVEFGPQSQADISRRLGWDPSDCVGIVDSLEADGSVERRRDESDRRRYALELTAAGRRRFDELAVDGQRHLTSFLGGLEPAERDPFVDMLRRVLAHLDERVPPSPA